jgi:aminopeptidase
MSTQVPVDGIVVGVQGGKVAAAGSDAISSLSRFTSVDVASQWASSRASSTKPGQLRVFYPSKTTEAVVAAVSIASDTKAAPLTGPDTLPAPETFLRNEHLEETRIAAAKGSRALKELPLVTAANGSEAEGGIIRRTIAVDSFTSPHAAATGSLLSLWKVNHFKSKGPGGAFGKEYELQGGRDIKVIPLAGEDAAALKDAGDELKGSTVPLSWKTGEV